MTSSVSSDNKQSIGQAIEVAVNLLLVILLLALCIRIVSPFISLIVWGAVIAIALYKPFQMMQKTLGGRTKIALALFVLLGIGLIVVPVWIFTGSVIESAMSWKDEFAEGTVSINPPSESVKDWPVIGKRVFALWSDASENLAEFLTEHKEQLGNIASGVFGKAVQAGLGVLQLILSILIAAAFLSSADACSASARRLARRLVGDEGDDFIDLSVSTIRSVTLGVLGIAAIQAILAGIGLVLADVPAAGVWVLLVLICAIVQLPPLLVLLPTIVYVFSEQSTTVAVVYMVWSILVGGSDTLLKPLLLGRGVDVPMLVILLGAIGGMIMSGIIGLFVGAVVLALGYKLFIAWLSGDGQHEANVTSDAAPEG